MNTPAARRTNSANWTRGLIMKPSNPLRPTIRANSPPLSSAPVDNRAQKAFLKFKEIRRFFCIIKKKGAFSENF